MVGGARQIGPKSSACIGWIRRSRPSASVAAWHSGSRRAPGNQRPRRGTPGASGDRGPRRGDQAGVDAAAAERAHRHVAHQAVAHCGQGQRFDLRCDFSHRTSGEIRVDRRIDLRLHDVVGRGADGRPWRSCIQCPGSNECTFSTSVSDAPQSTLRYSAHSASRRWSTRRSRITRSNAFSSDAKMVALRAVIGGFLPNRSRTR